MRHTPFKKYSAKASFLQAILLMVFLLVGFLGYKILKKGVITAGITSLIDTDIKGMRQLQSMDEEKKGTLQKTFSGFWIYKTEDSLSLVQKYDCLELRDNGIIWQVILWRIKYPSGDTGSFYHVRHAYLLPYSTTNNNDNIVCEVRTIRQVFVNKGDTCFGASQVDELWQVRREDTLLTMNRKKYTPYHGDVSLFFPDGMIDLIDKLIINDCKHNQTPATIIRNELQKYYHSSNARKTDDPEDIRKSLSEYYQSAYIDEIFSAIPYFPVLPDSIPVPISCDEKGILTVTLSKNVQTRLHHFEQMVINELATWPTPPTKGTEPLVIRYLIKLPAP